MKNTRQIVREQYIRKSSSSRLRSRMLFALIFLLSAFSSKAQIIYTYAGDGSYSYGGDGGQATAAQCYTPEGVEQDGAGNVYFADHTNYCIRKVNSSGIISTVAGTGGSSGYTGDGYAATLATLNGPSDVTIDASGNIYIADPGANVIRKVDASGIIHTVAGNGTAGYSGDGFAATLAKLNNPFGVAVDGSGNIYIADEGNNRIRMVDGSGNISTVAGNGLAGFWGDGGAAISAQLYAPMGVEVRSGNIYISDGSNNRVRMVDGSGNISTIVGNGVHGYSGDGGQATAAQIGGQTFMALDGSGNLFIAERDNAVIRKVDGSGIISTVAGDGTTIPGYSGDGGPATLARMSFPHGVTVDPAGDIFIGDATNSVVREVVAHHPCMDTSWVEFSSVTDRHGNCVFTGTAHVTTANLVLGYQWSGSGAAVIHHNHAHSDSYTFTLPPGGSVVITTTIYVVDTNFTDTASGPCCQSVLTQTVSCPGHGGPRSPGHGSVVGAKDNVSVISVYPNPTNGVVTVSSTQQDINTIAVIDVNGKKIAEYQYDNSQKVDISLNKFPPGTYLLRVNNTLSKVISKTD